MEEGKWGGEPRVGKEREVEEVGGIVLNNLRFNGWSGGPCWMLALGV